MQEEIVVVDNSNSTEEVTPEITEKTEETVEETIEQVREKLSKAETLANNYKIRAEKAEKSAKPSSDGLSSKDIIAITKANVPDEDIDEIIEYSRFKKVSVSEAMKSSVIKSLLQDRAEQRRIAEATNTTSARRGNLQVTDEELESKARSGKLPESEAEIKRLLGIRMGISRKK